MKQFKTDYYFASLQEKLLFENALEFLGVDRNRFAVN